MEKKKQPWYYSWVVILIALLIFWPVGIVLFILRLNHSKATASFGGFQKIVCYVIAGCLLFIGIISISEGEVLPGLLFASGGGVAIYYIRKAVKQSERYRQYINLIVNQGEESIDTIAGMCGQGYDVVVSDLNKMVSQGILKNAIIDQMSRTVILPKLQPVQQQMVYGGVTGTVDSAPPQMVTVACPGCGAKMAVAKGGVCNCEYCDTPINAR